MDIYASDDEKGEEIKRWWRENGRSIVIAVVIGLVALFGTRSWIQSQKVAAEQASVLYQNVAALVSDGDIDTADQQAQILFEKFNKTPYSVFAAFELASSSIETGDDENAKLYLNWVLENSTLSAHAEIARYRLAKVVLDEGDFVEAQKIINSSNNEAFKSLFMELAGDTYQAEGNTSEARASYQTVLLTLNQNEPRYALVKLKLDDLTSNAN